MNKILIIDDDEELCELVSEYLGVEGFEVESVNEGETGLKRALTGDYDMAILDVMLPKMNGFDVLRNLRAESTLPVIMLTARGDDVARFCGKTTHHRAADHAAVSCDPHLFVGKVEVHAPCPSGASRMVTRSAATISAANWRELVSCFQPSFSNALVASPISSSTSVGRK